MDFMIGGMRLDEKLRAPIARNRANIGIYAVCGRAVVPKDSLRDRRSRGIVY
jgi:hypothetical protein